MAKLVPFRYSRPSTWTGEPPRRDWLIEGLALKKTVLIFNGPGAVGKSLLMQQLMTACAIGGDFLGMTMPQVKSYGWFAEDPVDEMKRRQADLNQHYQVGPADTEAMTMTAVDEMDDAVLFHAAGRNSEGRTTPAWDSVRGHILAEGCQLAVLDNAALIFNGNANYPELVSPFMQEVKKLASDMGGKAGGLVIIIQHPSQEGESSGSGQAGARAWSNLARSRWYMTFPKDFDEVNEEICYERIIETKKNNYGPRKKPMRVEWRDGVFVPVMVSGESGAGLSTFQLSALRSRLESNVREMVRRGDKVSLMNGAPDHVATRLGKDPTWKMYSRGDITGAAERLLRDMQFVLVDVRVGNHVRRLIRTPEGRYPGEKPPEASE